MLVLGSPVRQAEVASMLTDLQRDGTEPAGPKEAEVEDRWLLGVELAGAIPNLVALLREGKPATQQSAFAALRKLSARQLADEQPCEGAGWAEAISTLIASMCRLGVPLQEDAIATLKNLAQRSVAHASEVAAEAIPTLVSIHDAGATPFLKECSADLLLTLGHRMTE